VVAEYVPGVTNRADKPSGTLTTRNDRTIRGDVLEELWHWMGLRSTIDAFAADHNHHLPLYWTYFPSPHASRKMQWRRSGTGINCCTSTLHGG